MDSPIRILRETEFYQGYIKFTMSVSNESPYVITDITFEFIYDDSLLYIADHGDCPVRNGKFVLGNIYGKKYKTITILFEPLTCAKAADIKCHLMYTDHEGSMASIFMKPKEISVVCPIMKTDQDINIGRLKEFITNLPRKDSRVYGIKSGFDVKKLAILAREVVEKYDVQHIRTLHTRDGKTCEIWYYGRTKIKHDDIVIRISIFTEYQTMELFAATSSAEVLTGLLAEVGRDLKNVVEDKASGRGRVVNVHIKDSVVQRSNLLDMCDMDGNCDVNIVIEDSVVQRSNIAYVDEETRLRQEKREEAERKRIPKKKMMFIPVIIIIVLAGYWMFSPLMDTGVIDYSLADTDNKTYSNSIGMEFVLIPAGYFDMGSVDTIVGVHGVSMEAFYLGKYEVTQEQWVELMGSNPSTFKGDNNPVEGVSWNDAQKFISKLNEKEGTDKYRLPSEAEWEYACKADGTTQYSVDDKSTLDEYMWYEENSGNKTHPIGKKKSNYWGLYDMSGNVNEWCQDRWHDDYQGAPTNGSAWEDGGSSSRIIRGGSYFDSASFVVQLALRYYNSMDSSSKSHGFRLAMDA